MTLIKSISGIRGTIGGKQAENLTPIDIVKFSTAFARLMSERRRDKSNKTLIVVGRDARISGDMVQSIITGTLIGCGVNIVDLGLCTTPGVEMAVVDYKADGGIIITASHNPTQWNALKLLGSAGEFIDAEDGRRVLEISEEMDFAYPTIESIGEVLAKTDYNKRHIEQVLALDLVNVEAIRSRKFRVVVDAVNSVGGIVIPELLRDLGCEVIELNCEANGHFAHNPEPLAENLGEIAAAVPQHKADLGVVVDPDVDRLALVSEDGTLFGEEYTLVAVADYILSRTKGATVSNLSSSRALRDVTRAHGCEYFASAVGEVNVVAEMKRVGAVIGGEGNGGVIYPDLHFGRDALVGVGLFLSLLCEKELSMSALKATYPAYFASKNKVELEPKTDISAILERLKQHFADEQIDDRDGVKIDFEQSWAHVRASNTEPILRIYTEAKNQVAADDLAQQIAQIINS